MSDPLTAIGFRLPAAGYWLPASGYRLSADRFAEERGPHLYPPPKKLAHPPQSGVGDHVSGGRGGRRRRQD